jgi:hypothetical protein
MKNFIEYWLAVVRLTQAQAFALFYRFARYVAPEWVERGWYNYKGEEVDVKKPKWYDFPPLSHCSVGVKNCKDPDCPVKKELARMEVARKKDQGDDVV